MRRLRSLLTAAAVLACVAGGLWLWHAARDGSSGRDHDAHAAVRATSVRAAPATPGDGSLHPLGGARGCLKGTGGLSWIPCHPTVRGQFDISSLAISPDGRFAYGVSLYSGYVPDARGIRKRDIPGGTIVAFAREPRTGALRQLEGDDACVRDAKAPVNRVTEPCERKAVGLGGAKTIALSPDGRFAYVAALGAGAIAAFARDPDTGGLRQLPGADACVGGQTGAGGWICPRAARALHGVRWIEVSADGRNLYAASPANDAIAAFARDPDTGGLRQLPGDDACIQDHLARLPSGCPTGVGLNYPRTIALAPDGRNAYVASDSADATFQGDAADGDAVSAFSRDPATGALRQLPGKGACIRDTIAHNNRLCPTVGRGLLAAFHVAVSPDGRNVYVGSDASRRGAIASFRRDLATGELVQLPGRQGCLGNGRGCGPAKGVRGADSVTISANGRRLYATGYFGQSVGVFARNPTTGVLRQLRGRGACIRDKTSKDRCSRVVKGLQGPRNVVLSPNGQTAYVPASSSGTITIFAVGRSPDR